MPLKIAQLGQPALRQIAAEVSAEEIHSPAFQQLVDDMLATLAQEEGAGLAGPQVFQSKRLFLAAVLPKPDPEEIPGIEVMVNPRITAASTETATAWEGCLSFPELLVKVSRRLAIRVEYLSRHGEPCMKELVSFSARVVQHECDHLDGVLTLDRAVSTKDIVKASEIEVVEGKKPPGP
ncbi:MAG TPA: peptide deformylase [Gemmataceae bacterium]|nr:peptide deformylase [Gemmataceae bacterium]